MIKLGLERDDTIFSELEEKSMAPTFLTLFNVLSEVRFPILEMDIGKMERVLRLKGRIGECRTNIYIYIYMYCE